MGWLLSRDALDIVVVVDKILEAEMMRRDGYRIDRTRPLGITML